MDIAALPTRYDTGAASVDAGGTIVTPTDATWYGNVWGDDHFFLPSQPLVPPQRIGAANPDGTLTLAFPWPGGAAVDEVYEIRYVGIIERSTAQSRKALEQLGDVKAWADVFVATDADRQALESPTNPLPAGRRVMVIEDGLIWVKKTTAYDDWLPPAAFKGDIGNKGWSPVHSLAVDGARRVWELVDWVGGEGTEPAGVGKYVGPAGLVDSMAEAIDVRGPAGDIDGLTLFWQTRVTTDVNAAAARVGLEIILASMATAQAGLNNTEFMTPLRTAQAILALSPSPADLEFSVSQLAMAVADALNVAQFLGSNGNRFADSFDALTYVDVAGATNLNASTVGVLKPSQATGISAVQGADPPTTGPSTGWQGSTHMTFTTPLTNGATYVTAGAFLTNAGTINLKIIKRNSSTNVDVVATTGVVSHPGGGWVDFPLASPFVVPVSGDYFVGFYMSSNTSTTYSSTTRSSTSGDVVGSNQTISAVGTGSGLSSRASTQGAIQNLTVRSTAFVAAVAPTKMKALVIVKEVDAAVAGTDYELECSRDNGTTWTAMSLTERYTMPTTGLRVVEAAETDVSAQPSGTAPRWRFKTLKNVELHDVYLYWS